MCCRRAANGHPTALPASLVVEICVATVALCTVSCISGVDTLLRICEPLASNRFCERPETPRASPNFMSTVALNAIHSVCVYAAVGVDRESTSDATTKNCDTPLLGIRRLVNATPRKTETLLCNIDV